MEDSYEYVEETVPDVRQAMVLQLKDWTER